MRLSVRLSPFLLSLDTIVTVFLIATMAKMLWGWFYLPAPCLFTSSLAGRSRQSQLLKMSMKNRRRRLSSYGIGLLCTNKYKTLSNCTFVVVQIKFSYWLKESTPRCTIPGWYLVLYCKSYSGVHEELKFLLVNDVSRGYYGRSGVVGGRIWSSSEVCSRILTYSRTWVGGRCGRERRWILFQKASATCLDEAEIKLRPSNCFWPTRSELVCDRRCQRGGRERKMPS